MGCIVLGIFEFALFVIGVVLMTRPYIFVIGSKMLRGGALVGVGLVLMAALPVSALAVAITFFALLANGSSPNMFFTEQWGLEIITIACIALSIAVAAIIAFSAARDPNLDPTSDMVGGVSYHPSGHQFPAIDPSNPYAIQSHGAGQPQTLGPNPGSIASPPTYPAQPYPAPHNGQPPPGYPNSGPAPYDRPNG